MAVRYEQIDVAKRMIDAGMDLHLTHEDKVTPLIIAAEAGHVDLVQMILAKRHENVDTAELCLAYLYARHYDHKDVMSIFSKLDAEQLPDGPEILDLDLPFIPKNLEQSFLTLDKVLSEEDRNLVMEGNDDPFFLHFGIGLWIRNAWGLWSNSRLSQYFSGIGVDHPDTMSAIILESYKQYLRKEPIQLNTQLEVCIVKPDPTRQNEMISAIDVGNRDFISAMLESGLDCNQTYYFEDNQWTGLMRSAYMGNERIVTIFLEAGAKVNELNWANQTALMFAAMNSHKKIVEILLKNGADHHLTTNWQDTALIYAAGSGSLETVMTILDHEPGGIEIYEMSHALINAVKSGNVDVVIALLNAGAVPEYTDRYGRTAVTVAARKGDIDIMNELMKHGGDINCCDHQGRTPLELAYGPEMRRYLKSQGAQNSRMVD